MLLLLQELGEDELHSYQFSVTEHLRRIDLRTLNAENSNGLLPGASVARASASVQPKQQGALRGLAGEQHRRRAMV